ncbi:reverse transcriptase domain-containing protein [Tanacetum coccineum]
MYFCLKALDEGYSSKNYVRKFLRALHPKWRAKVIAIEESKDLTSLSLDELIDDKNSKSDRKCFRWGDPNHLIEECLKPPKDKNQRAFVGGSWSDSGEEDDEKVKDEMCLMAHESSVTPHQGGTARLTRWFEKMETVFYISNCPERYQVKYASCTLLNSALTWWNSHKRTIRVKAAYAMSWAKLMKLMTEVYYPRNEVQKMETELWNLVVKGNDLTAYTRRFQELVLLCTIMVLNEEDKVERFYRGLPDKNREI